MLEFIFILPPMLELQVISKIPIDVHQALVKLQTSQELPKMMILTKYSGIPNLVFIPVF